MIRLLDSTSSMVRGSESHHIKILSPEDCFFELRSVRAIFRRPIHTEKRQTSVKVGKQTLFNSGGLAAPAN